MAAAELDGLFAVGTELTYGRLFKHHLRIAKMREQELVMIFGKYMGFSGVTKWEFRPMSTTAVEVTFTEPSSGFLLSRLYSSDKLADYLDAWLSHLKSQAEKARTE